MTAKVCPHCGTEFSEEVFIGTSQTNILILKDGHWLRSTTDGYGTYQCVACNEELTTDELDILEVPNSIR